MAGHPEETSGSTEGPLLWGRRKTPTPDKPRLWTWQMIVATSVMTAIIIALVITVSLWLHH